ncbi:MAG TPA: hypothetical protein VGE36_14170 [Roseateles sp.]
MVEDFGHPSCSVIAAALGVHVRTVERWRRDDSAPRAALLALYWITHRGQAELNHDLAYRASIYTAHIQAAKDENERLKRELARVLALGDSGAANLPIYRAETAAELMARPARRVSPSP